MKYTRILSILFLLAALCFAAGAVNHLLHSENGALSSAFLSLGCLCLSYACHQKKKN
ncbi:MAG: hypothetical protein J6K32_12015 [Clostridia bacterium]|nr:hypothetical protein [Clostridia bacterium]